MEITVADLYLGICLYFTYHRFIQNLKYTGLSVYISGFVDFESCSISDVDGDGFFYLPLSDESEWFFQPFSSEFGRFRM